MHGTLHCHWGKWGCGVVTVPTMHALISSRESPVALGRCSGGMGASTLICLPNEMDQQPDRLNAAAGPNGIVS
jgi:hypothetical protein